MFLDIVGVEVALDGGCDTFEKDRGFRGVFGGELSRVESRQSFCYISDHLS